MSAVKLNTAGGGSVVVQPASSIASDVTVSVPSATTTLVGTNTTQTLTNKTLTTPNIDSAQVATVSGTAPLYMCRAWVNFNGTGTVAIRASGNVSSITDNGVGDYTVNFSNAMPDANYVATTMAPVISDQGQTYQFGLRFPSGAPTGSPTLKTTTQVRLLARRESDFDLSECYVAIFR